MGHVAPIAGFLDCLQDGRIVEFLGVVQVVSTWVTCRVVKANKRMVRLQGADDVALHDLHVVNVVEEFKPAGSPPLWQTPTPQVVWSA